MTFEDVINLSSNFTVQQILERDMLKKRFNGGKPVYIHEFMYPLMVAKDSVVMDVDGEVGGNDQTFNMLVGRDLQKQENGKDKFVIPMKLLVDSSGAKMGKTTGNMLSFIDSADEKFGKVMS
jgi:tyrosyl-tRNA synthetase